MTTLYLILTILLIDSLSLLSPGQDFAIITRNTLSYSKRIGYYTVLGVGTVSFLHALFAVFGFSALIVQFPDALALIKTAGACYLIYLGTGFIKNAKNLKPNLTPQSEKNEPALKNAESLSPKKAFRMGAIANLLNAEPIIAYLSVFALVLPPESSLGLKIIICSLITLNTMLYYGLLAHVFSLKLVQTFLQKRLKTIEQIIGFVLVFLGFKTLQSVSNQ